MTNPILGGIKIPRVPPAATHPVDSLGSYLYLVISGMATMAMVAPVANEEPHMAANPQQAMMVAMASPPRACPSQQWAVLYISRLTPETKANCPISTNRGITLSVYDVPSDMGTSCRVESPA